jgi:hypothetical protein
MSTSITGPSGGRTLTAGNNAGAVSWAIQNAPSGMSLSATTGTEITLSWSNVSPGTYTIEVTATDSRDATCPGKTATQTFSLTVDGCPYGYCPDGVTCKKDAMGTNCPPVSPTCLQWSSCNDKPGAPECPCCLQLALNDGTGTIVNECSPCICSGLGGGNPDT